MDMKASRISFLLTLLVACSWVQGDEPQSTLRATPSFFSDEVKQEIPWDKPSLRRLPPVGPRISGSGVPAWQTRYTLGPGDTLTFSFYDRPDLKQEGVRIGPDGTVSYMHAVGIKAEGLTPDQLRARIEDEIVRKGGYKDPRVMISLDEIESKMYSIIGRVRSPGSYNLDRPTTVLEAIASAQGIQVGQISSANYELADFERSFVARRGKKLSVDFEKLYYRGDFTQNKYLEPDDYVFIASSLQNEVYVLGSVQNPGRLTMPKDLTIIGAIANTGGFVEDAFKKRVLLIRGSIHDPETHIVDMRAIVEGRAPDIKLEPRDIVYVNLRPFEMVEKAFEAALIAYMQTVTAQYITLNYNPLTQ